MRTCSSACSTECCNNSCTMSVTHLPTFFPYLGNGGMSRDCYLIAKGKSQTLYKGLQSPVAQQQQQPHQQCHFDMPVEAEELHCSKLWHKAHLLSRNKLFAGKNQQHVPTVAAVPAATAAAPAKARSAEYHGRTPLTTLEMGNHTLEMSGECLSERQASLAVACQVTCAGPWPK